MKYCEEYAALLDAFVDGELSSEEAEHVREHLLDCDACAAYVENALAVRAAFPDVDSIEVPPGFADGVCAAIRANAAPRKRSRRWLKASASAIACAAIVFAALRIMPEENHVAKLDVFGTDSSPIAESRSADISPVEDDLPMEFQNDMSKSSDDESSDTEIVTRSSATANSAPSTVPDHIQSKGVAQVPAGGNRAPAPSFGMIEEVASGDIGNSIAADFSSLNYSDQALEIIQPEPATYDERLRALDDLVQLHYLSDSEFQTTVHTENGSAIAWYGKILGTPQMDANSLYLSFADGSITQLPLPKSSATGTAEPDSMRFDENTLAYEITFTDDLPDETSQDVQDFIHVKGTYRYTVDLDSKTVSLKIQ